VYKLNSDLTTQINGLKVENITSRIQNVSTYISGRELYKFGDMCFINITISAGITTGAYHIANIPSDLLPFQLTALSTVSKVVADNIYPKQSFIDETGKIYFAFNISSGTSSDKITISGVWKIHS